MKYAITPQSFILPAIGGLLAGYFWQDAAVGVAAFALSLMPLWIRIYIEYAKDNPKHLWFKAKRYGWGWTPATWQGWAVTAIYAGILVLLSLTLDEHSPPNEVGLMFVLPLLILSAGFIVIAWKTGEKPRWRWESGK